MEQPLSEREGYKVRRARVIQLVAGARKLPLLPVIMLLIVIFCAIFAPLIAPHDPTDINLNNILRPPFWSDTSGNTYILGTDNLGRDVLSRIIFGSRISAIVGIAAAGFAAVAGVTLGLISGYFGGWLDALIMRATDIMLALPPIFIALVLVAVLNPSLGNVVLVFALVHWAQYARLVRGEVLSVKKRDFISLTVIAGCSPTRIMLKHVLPNVVGTVLVLATLQVGIAILFESILSFLGMGVPPPTPTWGGMVSDGRSFITSAWWLTTFPGLAIAFTVLSINLVGDWLADFLDPMRRQAYGVRA